MLSLTGCYCWGSIQVLDGETLALIWCGNISRWNHPSLALLNQGVTMPDAPIYLTWYRYPPRLVGCRLDAYRRTLSNNFAWFVVSY
jgi:hypothetical protein